MTDKLTMYNLALHDLGETRIASLSEACDRRRVLDDFYDQTLQVCLEAGLWNFMLRTVQIDASTTIVPSFGFKYAFNIPVDWVRTILVSTVETFVPPDLDYREETGYWYDNFTPIFVQYLSKDPLYGLNLGAWPGSFAEYFHLSLAVASCKRITGATELLQGPDGLKKAQYKAMMKAKSNDAMDEPPQEMPTGTWTRARRGFLRGVPLPGGTQFDD